MSKMVEQIIYSASCPNLTLVHEWTITKLNSDNKTKSLPNMALTFNDFESKKNIAVESLFQTEKILSMTPLKKKYSASCPNLTLSYESTVEKLKCDNKTKSLPDMALAYSDELEIKKAHNSEKLTEIESVQEEIEVPKKKKQTVYKRVKRFFKCLCCCCP